MSLGKTETVILTTDSCNVKHRRNQVQRLMSVAKKRVDL